MAEDNNTDQPENLVLLYSRCIDTRLEGGGGLDLGPLTTMTGCDTRQASHG
jgi:hypothetical protein